MENMKEIVENLNEEILNEENENLQDNLDLVPFDVSACVAEDFCCMVTAPADATYFDRHIAIFPEKLNIKNSVPFYQDINGCRVKLRKVTIEACLKLIINWGFKDKYKNHSHVCCTDYLCMCDKEIICCCEPLPANIKFTVIDFNYDEVIANPICPDTKIYKLTGKIKPQCDC